jgi:2-haloacid dehalogenase
MLDRGFDPITTGYDYITLNSLDEVNKHLGL